MNSFFFKFLVETYSGVFLFFQLKLRFWDVWYRMYYFYKIYAYRAYTEFRVFAFASPLWTNTSLNRRLSNLPSYNKKRWWYRSSKFYNHVFGSYSRVKRRYINFFNFFSNYLNLAFKIRRFDFLDEKIFLEKLMYFSRNRCNNVTSQ